MNGEFCGDQFENIVDFIQSVRSNCTCCVFDYNPGECPTIGWDIFPMKPKVTMPHKLIKNDNIEFYVLLSDYGEYGHIFLKKRRCLRDDDHLLAEIFAEDGFDYGFFYHRHKIAFFRDV
uniref:Uncharacterized protein n=1 Tax=Panagrolaimus sp. PS1159 TaxID=55785 RepID=A0AC35GNX0_9BILA